MAETVGDLELNLRAKIGDLERDLKKAEGLSNTAGKRIARNMQGAFKGIGAIRVKLGLLAFGLAQIAALGGMKRLIDGSLAAADAIGRTSDKLGISNSALQEFQYAAVQSGVKIETLNMGLQRFGRRSAEAAGGSGEAQAALKQLDIQLTDTNGSLRSTEDLFVDSMKALAGIENPLERVRLGFKLFDSEGVALVNMAGNLGELRDEAQSLGLVLDDEVIARSSETKDTLAALSQVTKAQLLPALVDLGGGALIVVAEQLAEASLWANRMYRSFADVGNLGLSNLNKKVVEQQSGLDKMIETQKAAEKHFSDRTRNPDTDHFLRSRIESRRKRILERKADIEETKKNIKEKIKARKEEMALLRGGDAPVNINAEKKAADKRLKIAAEAMEEIRSMRATDIQNINHERDKKIADLKDATEKELEIYGGKKKVIEAIDAAAKIERDAVNAEAHDKMMKLQKKEVDLEKEKAAKIKEMRDGIHQEFLEATKTEEEMVRINLANDVAELEKNINEKGYLQAQFAEDKVKLEKIAEEEIRDLRSGNLDLEKKYIDERTKAFEDSYGFIRDGFADAMADMLIDGKFNFKALYQSFLREFVNRAVARLAGSAFTSLGNIFSPTPIGPVQADGTFNGTGLANGGPISGPTLVGERGPELFLPHTSGFIANNQSLNKMGGGGGGSVSVTVINNTGKETSTTERDGPGGSREIEVMVGKAISKNISRGGDVDQAIRNSYGVNRVGRHGV
jgi:hypothetical protein